MDKWSIIKGSVAAIFLLFILLFAVEPVAEALASLSEPGVLVYGQVRDENGELVVDGTLTLTVTPQSRETLVIEKHVQLGLINSNNIQYSYRLLLNMETPVAGHGAASNTIQLSQADVTYQWTATIEGLGISRSGTFDLGYDDCGTGRNISIDARTLVDEDNDGLPDEWEVLYQLATDSAEGDDGPDGDPDHDGLTNLEEYLRDSNPQVADITIPNTSPSAPSQNAPADGAEITSDQPVLSVNNAVDPDENMITYAFQMYADEGLTALVFEVAEVAEGENVTTMTAEETLPDNAFYYWRARAFDGEENSPWTDVAIFFVNTENDPPGMPVLSYPRDGSETSDLQPTLVIHTASDPDLDPLSHEFAVYSDEALTAMVAGPGIIDQVGTGECSWTIDAALNDGATYYWSAWAVDDEGAEGGRAAPYSFTVNTANHAPTGPAVALPAQDAEVEQLSLDLSVTNGSDADGDTLVYEFQVDSVDTFDGTELESSGRIDEGAGGETSWTPASEFNENTVYYWRACAYDGHTYSSWIQGSFFVNMENSAPTIPGILNPGEGSSVSDLMPLLSIVPARDADRDTLTYDYQVFSNISLIESSLVASTEGAGTTWQVSVSLTNKAGYVWRARAVDEHGLAGNWSGVSSFNANANMRPAAPVLNNPVSGGVVTSLTPVLSVRNAVNSDVDDLFYEFELYSDGNLDNQVATGLIGEDALITSWTVSVTLTDNSTYYWRARAYDGILEGPWTPTVVFNTRTSGAETVVTTEASVAVSADTADDQVVGVTDEDSPILGVSVSIPPGALTEDCTVTIGWVENPPALPKGVIALGNVLEFGPHGTVFDAPVTITIPYTENDLNAAGVSDPAELSLMTFDSSTLIWESMTVTSVDTEGRFLIASVDHFSLYAKCGDGPSTSSGGSGGGSGGCFIQSTMAYVGQTSFRWPAALGLLGLFSGVAVSAAGSHHKGKIR